MEEERNECIKHFSHEHPLRVFELDYLEDPNPKAHRCHICGLPILHSPSYTCSSGNECSFYLHKACAESMAEEIKHDHLHEGILGLEPADSSSSFMYRCRYHFESYYSWGDDSCALKLHPLVANPVEIRSKHMSHESHPLVALCREIVCVCNVCGEEEKSFFFYCQQSECNYWVHQDCTILPRAVKLQHHHHPYILAYSIPREVRYNNLFGECSICKKMFHQVQHKNGVYFCCECSSWVHVGCAKSSMINRNDIEFLRLPEEEEEEKEEERRFPSLAIRRFCSDSDGGAGKKMVRHHGHPLIGVDDADSDVCNVCTQPLQILSYKCHQQDCPFAAHEMCAHNLPTTLGILTFTLTLVDSSSDQLRACLLCARPFNGFAYELYKEYYYDVECALVPKTVNHSSHNQHLLFQNDPLFLSYEHRPAKLNCCSDMTFLQGFYRCVVCLDFCIHVRCALLPQKTRHKFDKHPLHLITTTLPLPKTEQHLIFCELCEKPIDLQFWYYGCHHCTQYFHINCIPSVGYLLKIKFGHQPNCVLPQHHQHPLNLTRMLTHAFNERCAVCNQLIRGFSEEEEDIALHCSPCHFWIHFSCVSHQSDSITVPSLTSRLMN